MVLRTLVVASLLAAAQGLSLRSRGNGGIAFGEDHPECATCEAYRNELPGEQKLFSKPSGTGYLMLAFGNGYLEMAKKQVEMFRKTGEKKPVSVVTDSNTYDNAKSAGVFDKVVLYRDECFRDGLTEMTHTSQERFNMMPQLRFLSLSPYAEFMKWDLDIVPTSKGTADVWKAFQEHGQGFADFGKIEDRDWHWGHLGEISDQLLGEGKIKRAMHHTHAGVMYVNRDLASPKRLQTHFDAMADAIKRYDELHFLRQFRGGATDEVLISFAYASQDDDWKPIDFGDLMSFEYKTDAPHRLSHLFDQGDWLRAAGDILKEDVDLHSDNVKGHAEGGQDPFTCA